MRAVRYAALHCAALCCTVTYLRGALALLRVTRVRTRLQRSASVSSKTRLSVFDQSYHDKVLIVLPGRCRCFYHDKVFPLLPGPFRWLAAICRHVFISFCFYFLNLLASSEEREGRWGVRTGERASLPAGIGGDWQTLLRRFFTFYNMGCGI